MHASPKSVVKPEQQYNLANSNILKLNIEMETQIKLYHEMKSCNFRDIPTDQIQTYPLFRTMYSKLC